MYLFIDTSQVEFMTLALLDKKGEILVKKKIQAKYQQSEKLLSEIDKILKAGTKVKGLKDIKENRIRAARLKAARLNNLEGIMVVKGPGSFTGLRIGITTANVLAFALGIRSVGVAQGELAEMVADGLRALDKLGTTKSYNKTYKTYETHQTYKTYKTCHRKRGIYMTARNRKIHKDWPLKQDCFWVLPEYGLEPNITLKPAGKFSRVNKAVS